jgi:hypothetical protein
MFETNQYGHLRKRKNKWQAQISLDARQKAKTFNKKDQRRG